MQDARVDRGQIIRRRDGMDIPVRCRLNSSIGTTWLYPPPAAPPLCRRSDLAGLADTGVHDTQVSASAWLKPTVVVVCLHQRVGVMAVTSM
jgi:hypothetical protein